MKSTTKLSNFLRGENRVIMSGYRISREFTIYLAVFIIVCAMSFYSCNDVRDVEVISKDTPLLGKLNVKCKKLLGRSMMAELNGGGSTLDMVQSQQEWMFCQDKLMNLIFIEVKKEVKRFSKYDDENEYIRKELRSMPKKLDESQKLWLDAMSLTCQVEADQYVGGTLSSIVYGNCKAEMTSSRIRDMARLYRSFTDH